MLVLIKRHLSVVLFLLVVTILMTLPAILHLTDYVIGSGGDPWQTLWRLSSTGEQLQSAAANHTLGTFLRQQLLGQGESRLVNLSAWPWLWLHFLGGEPLAYNLIWLLSFVLSGWGMYTLCRYLIRELPHPPTLFLQEGAALVGGILYMFLPFHFAHALGHFGALQIQWLPWLILLLFRLRDQLRWRDACWFALLLVAQVWTEHHYALWFAIFTLLFCVWEYQPLKRGFQASLPRALFLGGIVLLATVVIVLSYLPTIRLANHSASALALGVEQTIRFSADPFAYVIPAVLHPLWGNLMANSFAKYFTGNVAESTQFLGLFPLLLLLFFHQHLPRRQKYFWTSVAALFAVLSFGPRLHLMGIITPLPLPYALLDNLPIFSAVRTVARAGVMVGFSLSVLVSLVIATQFKRLAMVALAMIIVLLEFLATPIPLQSAEQNPVYQKVASLPGETIIEIPAATNYVTASRALYASLRHGKTVIGNIALERGETPETLDDARSLPALRQLLYVRTNHLDLGRSEFLNQDMVETAADVLRDQKVAAFLVHTDSITAHQATVIREFLEQELGLTAEEYADMLLYPVIVDQLPASDGIFAERKDGWEYAYDATRQSTFAEVLDTAYVAITNTTSLQQTVKLAFTFAPESHTGLQVRQGENVIWEGVGTLAGIQNIVVAVPPGTTTLEFKNNQSTKVILQNPVLTAP